jgi:hypothetical protein
MSEPQSPTEHVAARLIWETSRADEGTISATGADHVARALRRAGLLAPPTPSPQMTARQAKDWPDAVARVRRHGCEVTEDPTGYGWTLDWHEEVRPGRGHYLSATWNDGEHFAQITMDVYGGPVVSVAALDWIHSDSYEECDCEPCDAERETERQEEDR